LWYRFLSTYLESSMKSILTQSITLALGALVGSGALAQAAKAPDGQWHGGVNAGISAASGNTTASNFSLNIDTANETTADKTVFYTNLLRGTSGSGASKVTSAELYRLGGRYERNLSAQLFGFGGLELERDGVAHLNLRTSLTAGLGYKVIVSDPLKFNVFGGIGYARNDYDAPLPDSKGTSLMIGEESFHTLSKDTSVHQRLELEPAGGDLGTRAKWDLGFVTALPGSLTANANLGLRYASKVPTGVKKTDTVLSFGVGYKF